MDERIATALERIATALEAMVPGVLLTTEQKAEHIAALTEQREREALEEELRLAKEAVDLYDRVEKQEKRDKVDVAPKEQVRRDAARERLKKAEAALKGTK